MSRDDLEDKLNILYKKVKEFGDNLKKDPELGSIYSNHISDFIDDYLSYIGYTIDEKYDDPDYDWEWDDDSGEDDDEEPWRD